jgi:hypothetical protein
MKRRRSASALYRDYRLAFRSGVGLEVADCHGAGIASMLAADHMRNARREAVIVSCGVMPVDRNRSRDGREGVEMSRSGLRFVGPPGPGFRYALLPC